MSCTTECTGIEYSKQGSQTITQVVVGKPTKSVVLKMVEIYLHPPPSSHAHSPGSLHGLSTTSPISISRSHMTWNTTCTIQNSITHISADHHYCMYSQVNIKGTMHLLIHNKEN